MTVVKLLNLHLKELVVLQSSQFVSLEVVAHKLLPRFVANIVAIQGQNVVLVELAAVTLELIAAVMVAVQMAIIVVHKAAAKLVYQIMT